jgi:hypothetical protein
MTICDDRYHDPIYIGALNAVVQYGPEKIITGYFSN